MPTSFPQKAKWNPADYAANSASQHAWARELFTRLNLRGDERILDVGCGDGKVTAELARAMPRGTVTGIDSSAEMVRFARATFPHDKRPNLDFRVMDAREITMDRRVDIVFSSSVLHWVDDHPAFLRGAASVLHPGGRLLVSCGGKGNAQEVFLALRPEMRLKRWSKYFRKMEKPYFLHTPGDYEKWLPRFGFTPQHVALATKDAVYDSPEKFVAWFRTTWLPYTQRVPEALREEFIGAVTTRYLAKHPPDDDGRIRVRMVRLEIDAVKI